MSASVVERVVMFELTDQELQYALWCLAFALLGILASMIGALTQATQALIRKYHEHKARQAQQLEEVLNEALDEVMVNVFFPKEPQVTNYRHNIHCPSCGRFSKRVWGSSLVVECKVHGVEIRWKDVPADWAQKPVTPEVVIRELPTLELEVITGPIPVMITEPLHEEPLIGPIIDRKRMIQAIPG